MSRVALSIATLLLLSSCGSSSWSGTNVTDVAQAWTGHTRLPLCRSTGRDGEPLGSPGARYCEWDTPSKNPAERLTGILTTAGATVVWVRAPADIADADRVVDSLNTAFESRGLRRRKCAPRTSLSGETLSQLWESDTLTVWVGRTARPVGVARLQVTLVDSAAVLSTFLCGAPGGN